MRSRAGIAVFLLVLALILAVGCALQESGQDSLEPGGKGAKDEIGDDGGGNGNATAGNDQENEDAGKDSVSDGDKGVGNDSGGNVADDPDGEVFQDSGIYLGQADSHSIEIHISGVPWEVGSEVFQLSGKVQEEFESYGFEKEDDVKFTYVLWDHAGVTTKTIIEIVKINTFGSVGT